MDVLDEYIHHGKLVGVEKSLNESCIFQLLYEHTKLDDLCIVMNILNEEEILIMTVIEKSVNKRRHYEH